MNLFYPLTTLTFAYPWAFLAPVVLLFGYFLRKQQDLSALFPSRALLAGTSPSLRQLARAPVLTLLFAVGFLALSVAAARPQRVTNLEAPDISRNLILALDISRSMGTPDFKTGFGTAPRLQAVKSVVADFIKNRPADRIGVVVFGSNAFLQAPLTRDHQVLQDLVGRLEVGMAGDGTAMGDGLGLSLKRIEEIPSDTKAVILLSDGVSNSGQVNPLKAAKVAANLGVRVHTIGIGSSDPVSAGWQGMIFQGSTQPAEFDEATLKKIAEVTGGVYQRAEGLSELREVYGEIDKLEKSSSEDYQETKVEEFFPFYALIALSALFLYWLFKSSIFLKVP